MREKLIELLCKAHGMATDASLFEDASFAQQLETEADFLIANGVTIPVRCKDCEKWQRHTHVDRERGHCRRFDITKHEYGFCDRGERKDNETL